MISHTNRKDFFYIVVLILTFITVVVGMAFAIYTWIFSQEEGSSAVYTGTLSIEYLSGNIIDFNLLIPNTKPTFNTKKNVYRNDFRVTNTGSLNGVVSVSVDIESNSFSNNSLKYILFDSDGNELASDFLNGTGDITIINNIVLESNQTENFVFIIWLNENDEVQNNEMEKTLVGAIDVNASQQRD